MRSAEAVNNDRGVRITFSDDAAGVLGVAEEWLVQRPVEHNLILTLLHQRAAFPQDGRYWIATDGDELVGVVFQSPTTFHATITPMDGAVVDAVVDAIAAFSTPSWPTPRRTPSIVASATEREARSSGSRSTDPARRAGRGCSHQPAVGDAHVFTLPGRR